MKKSKYVVMEKEGKVMKVERKKWMYLVDYRCGVNTDTFSFGRIDGVDFKYRDFSNALIKEVEKK